MLSFALLEHGRDDEARALLDGLVTELESFAFPQWHSLAAILAAEAMRRQGALDTAQQPVDRGLEPARSAQYWYAVGFAQGTAGRILRHRGDTLEAEKKLADAVVTFERRGSGFEARRTP